MQPAVGRLQLSFAKPSPRSSIRPSGGTCWRAYVLRFCTMPIRTSFPDAAAAHEWIATLLREGVTHALIDMAVRPDEAPQENDE